MSELGARAPWAIPLADLFPIPLRWWRRFQYIVLAYFLHTGEWPPPYGGVPGQPSIANSHEWPRCLGLFDNPLAPSCNALARARRRAQRRQRRLPQLSESARRAGPGPSPAAPAWGAGQRCQLARSPPPSRPLRPKAPASAPPHRPLAARSIVAYLNGTNALFDGREQCQCLPRYAATDNRHYAPEGGAYSLHLFRYIWRDARPDPRSKWLLGEVYGFYGSVSGCVVKTVF